MVQKTNYTRLTRNRTSDQPTYSIVDICNSVNRLAPGECLTEDLGYRFVLSGGF